MIQGDIWGKSGLPPWQAFLVFSLSLFITFALGVLLKRWLKLSAEGSRKVIHLGLGLNSLTLPWLFAEPQAVWLLALASMLGLAWLRSHRLRQTFAGNALHGVDRKSWGDLCFPLSIAILFQLAFEQQQAWLYWLPIFLLTVSDAVSAMVGVRWGKNKYATVDGWKSIEGSLGFFGCTFALTLLAIWASGMSKISHLIPAAVLFSALLTLVEGVSWRGLDNLLTPLGAYVWMDRLLLATPTYIWKQILILAFLILLMGLIRNYGQLSARAMLLLILAGETYSGLGGWWWMALPLWYLIANTRLRSTNPHRRALALREAVSVNVAPMACLLLVQIHPDWKTSTGFATSFLAHWVMTSMAHQKFLQSQNDHLPLNFTSIAWIIVYACFISIWPWINLSIPQALAVSLLSIIITCVAFYHWQLKPYGVQDCEGHTGRWFRQGFIGVSVATLTILFVHWIHPM